MRPSPKCLDLIARFEMWAVTLARASASTDFFEIQLRGDVGGDPVLCRAQSAAGGSTDATTTTGFTANTWHHVCCVFASTTSRSAYLNGGSKGTNTTSNTPLFLDTTQIAQEKGAGFFNGAIAEVGIWRVALSDADVATLAAGLAPRCVVPNGIVGYYPMIRDATTLKDLYTTANNLTLTGGTVSAHPRIIQCK